GIDVAGSTGQVIMEVRRVCDGGGCPPSDPVSITWDVVQQPVSGEIISLEDSEIFEVCAGNPIEVFVINGIGGVNGTDIIEWGYSNPDPVASLDTFVAFPNTTGSIGWYPATMPFIAPAFTDNNNNFIRFN